MAISACASQPEDIGSTSVSTLQYQHYTCRQVALESDRINRRVHELYKSLDEKADNDGAQMAVGLILFWPALFFLEGGDGPEAVEYSRLKGEREAIEKVAVQKECDIEFPPLEMETTVAEDAATQESEPVQAWNKRGSESRDP